MANIARNAAGNWSNPAQWVGGVLPGAADTAYLGGFAVTLDQDVTCLGISNDLNTGIAAGGTLTIATIPPGGRTINAALTCNGAPNATLINVTANANTLTINGSGARGATGTGGNVIALTGNNGSTVVLNGSYTAGAGGGNCHAIACSGAHSDLTINGSVTGAASSALGVQWAGTVGKTLTVTGTINNCGVGISNGGTGHTLIASNVLNTTVGVTTACIALAGTQTAATVINTTGSITAGTGPLLTANHTAGTVTVNINGGTGAITAGATALITAGHITPAILNVNAGTITGPSSGSNAGAVTLTASGTVNVAATLCIGGAGAQSTAAIFANTTNGVINITGEVCGAATGSGCGAYNQSTGTINVYGIARGGVSTAAGTHGLFNVSTGTATATTSISNDYPNGGNTQQGYGTYQSSVSRWITIDNSEDGSGGWPATFGRHFVRDAGTNYAKMRNSNLGTITTMGEVSADYPVAANVRAGTVYNFGALTGTLAVPSPAAVMAGVPTDNTVGSAALSAAAIATAVRTELTTELARIDAAVSTRLAAVGYTAPPSAATNATAVRAELATELTRVDATVSSRLAAAAYTAPLDATATQTAAATAIAAYAPATTAQLVSSTNALIAEHATTQLAIAAIPAPDNATIAAIKKDTGLIPALL